MKFILLMLLLVHFLSYGQNFNKPILSPEASTLLQIKANEVDLFSGNSKIAIPLYFNETGGYKINLSLNYTSGGIKVAQKSTNVGLGWYLAASGGIVRKTRGVQDENISYVYEDNPGRYNIAIYGQLVEFDLDNANTYYNETYQFGAVQDLNLTHYLSGALSDIGDEASLESFQDNYKDFFFIPYSSYGSYGAMINRDTEPDIFEFNFNGKSGKFVFENDNGDISVHQIPWMGLKIEYTISNYYSLSKDKPSFAFTSFVITDTDNTKYYFEACEESYAFYDSSDVAQNLVADPGGDFDPTLQWKRIYTTNFKRSIDSWKLTKVVTPSNRVINYNYETEWVYNNNYTPMQVISDHHKVLNENVFQTTKYITPLKTLTQQLVEIETDNFSIEFSRNTQNLAGIRQLEEIRVVDRDRNLIQKRIGFDYGFSICEGYNLASNEEKHLYNRLILKEVKDYSKDFYTYQSYKFYYNLKDFGGSDNQELPPLNSSAVDLWGFYNGKVENTHFVPKMFVYPDLGNLGNERFQVEELKNYTGRKFVFDGADRAPDKNFMDYGALNKIEYPTGGSTLYEYEPNEYIYLGETFLGPGLRTSKITLRDGNKEDVYIYNYNDLDGTSSGRIIAKPILARINANYSNLTENNEDYYKYSLARYSDSQAELTCVDNRIIGYGRVSEIKYGLGRTVNIFSLNGRLGENDVLFNEEEELADQYGDCEIKDPLIGYCDGFFEYPKVFSLSYGSHKDKLSAFSLNPPANNTVPFAPAPNYDWNRGMLLSKEFYNEEGQKVKKVINIYDNYVPGEKTPFTYPHKIYGLKINPISLGRPNQFNSNVILNYTDLSGTTFRASKYKIITDITKVLSSRIEYLYYSGTNLKTITNRIDYEYSSENHSYPTEISTLGSEGVKFITKYKYPLDYESKFFPINLYNVIYEMKSRNMIDKPIEVLNYIQDVTGLKKLRSAVITKYIEENNMILPYEIYNLFKINDLESSFKESYIDVGTGKLHQDERYIESISINRYDYFGNVLETENKESGVKTSYIWGYNQSQPIAKIENISYSDIGDQVTNLQTLSNADDDRTVDSIDTSGAVTYQGKEGDLREALASLRASLPPESMMTSYTYDPLIGVTSITDSRGYTTYYEYDEFNRLRYVKDQEGNVLTKNEYHYKSQ